MTILLIEPRFDGHHFTYLHQTVKGALDRDLRVIVGVGDDDQGRTIISRLQASFGTAFSHVAAPLPVHGSFLPAPFNFARRELLNRCFFRDLFAVAQEVSPIDHVLLLYMDLALFAIGLLGSPFGNVKFSGITMRQSFHLRKIGIPAAHNRMHRLKERLFGRLLELESLERVFTIDETLVEYLSGRGAGFGKVVYFPDPCDRPDIICRNLARKRIDIPTNVCVILVYGHLDHRKGIRRLLEWVESDENLTSAHLLAVGRQSEETEALFSSRTSRQLLAEGRLHLFNRFVEPDEESEFFAAADLVWVAYDGFEMMSSVLVKAALHGRAVVYSNYGLIARYAEKYGLLPNVDWSWICENTLSSMPEDLRIRTFEPSNPANRVPDHSWRTALSVIYG